MISRVKCTSGAVYDESYTNHWIRLANSPLTALFVQEFDN